MEARTNRYSHQNIFSRMFVSTKHIERFLCPCWKTDFLGTNIDTLLHSISVTKHDCKPNFGHTARAIDQMTVWRTTFKANKTETNHKYRSYCLPTTEWRIHYSDWLFYVLWKCYIAIIRCEQFYVKHLSYLHQMWFSRFRRSVELYR